MNKYKKIIAIIMSCLMIFGSLGTGIFYLLS